MEILPAVLQIRIILIYPNPEAEKIRYWSGFKPNFDTDPDPGKNYTDPDPGNKKYSTRKILKIWFKKNLIYQALFLLDPAQHWYGSREIIRIRRIRIRNTAHQDIWHIHDHEEGLSLNTVARENRTVLNTGSLNIISKEQKQDISTPSL